MNTTHFLIELHCHTAESSSCGTVNAEELVRLYKQHGYDGIVITDHLSDVICHGDGANDWKAATDYFLSGYRAAKSAGDRLGLKVYLGAEIRFLESPNDYLLFGITQELIESTPRIFDMGLQKFRAFADKNNIMIVQAHPYRQPCQPADADLLDGMEVYNGHKGHDSHNNLAEEYATKHGLIPTAGSDCHYLHAVGTAAVRVAQLPDTVEDLVKILKCGEYELEIIG